MNQTTTEKLYDKDAYMRDFSANVISCNKRIAEDGNEVYDIILDRTAFFPEEGGQTSDSGTIDGAVVSKVSIIDDILIHTADKAIPVGKTVNGTINWEHRYSNMQQHSGEHLFSGIVHSKFGFDNVGFHLSDDIVTMDYNGVLSKKDINEVERLVNQAIYENLETVVSWPDAEELAKIEYRSKKELQGAVRIVTFPGYDCCACCAPHIRKTGEIGILKVMSLQNYKKGVRVSILCGKRAVDAFDREHDMLCDIAASLTTSADQIQGSIDKFRKDNADLKGRLADAQEKLIEYRMKEIPEEQTNVFLFMSEGSEAGAMRKTANMLVSLHKGYCGVFCPNGENNFRFIAGSSDRDAREFVKMLGSSFTAKGGGSAEMVQGTITNASEAELTKFTGNIR